MRTEMELTVALEEYKKLLKGADAFKRVRIRSYIDILSWVLEIESPNGVTSPSREIEEEEDAKSRKDSIQS